MTEQKIIFSCDHIINKLVSGSVTFDMTRSTTSVTDTIMYSGRVVNVFYVYTLTGSAAQVINYKKGVDYTISDNEITWISSNKPVAGAAYVLEALVTTRTITEYVGNISTCERCAGQGWYVDAFTKDNKSIQKAVGINKLVQDYIKVLYTEKATDGYGTDLTDLTGEYVPNEDLFLSDIATAINDAATQLKAIQATFDTSYITTAEMLSSVTITVLSYAKEECLADVELVLTSQAGSTATVNFIL